MLTLYEAVHGYVTKYVNLYYDTSDKIIGDNEIQTFGQELTKSKSDGGCGILSPLTEEDIVKCVVDRETTIEVISLAVILSEKIRNALGDFEVNYTYDPAAVKIVEEKELIDIGQNINQRNEKLERKFEYLHPEEIPNSVSL
uniref:Uncharacterized protein n=1 Tax=Magallana gigas TaxID=29159 RepID=K1QA46_MAGGI